MNELKENLPKMKQTALELYVTAREAYEKCLEELGLSLDLQTNS